jgi:hypothetical protein
MDEAMLIEIEREALLLELVQGLFQELGGYPECLRLHLSSLALPKNGRSENSQPALEETGRWVQQLDGHRSAGYRTDTLQEAAAWP